MCVSISMKMITVDTLLFIFPFLSPYACPRGVINSGELSLMRRECL